MKLIMRMLIVSTFARYNQMRNFRKHHRNTIGQLEIPLDEETVHPSERLGSSVDKAAFRQYSYQKYDEANGIENRERLSRWFDHFKKYCTVYKYWNKHNFHSIGVSHNLIILIVLTQTLALIVDRGWSFYCYPHEFIHSLFMIIVYLSYCLKGNKFYLQSILLQRLVRK